MMESLEKKENHHKENRIATMMIFSKLLLIISIFFLTGCAVTPSVTENFLKNYQFSEGESVAILPFIEQYSFRRVNKSSLTDEPTAILSMELMNSKVHVVDETFFTRLIEKQKISLTGLMNQGDYAKIGKIVKADFVITGNISLTKAVGSRRGTISLSVIDVATGNIVYSSFAEMSDIWGGLNVYSFREALIKKTGKKLVEFFNSH